MKFSFHLARYDKYLNGTIKSYEEWLSEINNRITIVEKLPIKHFMIGHKKKRAQTPEIAAKLLQEAQTNKENIQDEHRRQRNEVEMQLNFYRQEKEKCTKLLTIYHGKTSQAN